MPRPLVVLALFLLIASLLLPLLLPQRPDGDNSAIAAFDAEAQARFGRWLPLVAALGLLDLRHAVWPNLAGALLALWSLDLLLTTLGPQPSAPSPQPPRLSAALFALGLLIALTGWGWERSRGWWGELFLTPGAVAPLGPDRRPALAFERFDQPPEPSGPGRALTMTIRLDGETLQISAGRPHRVGGWTVRPHWYGGVVQLTDGPPLFFGLSGTKSVVVHGEPVTVTLNITSLDATIAPPRPYKVTRFAVIRARYAPGAELRLIGLGLMALAATLATVRRPLGLPRFFSKRLSGL